MIFYFPGATESKAPVVQPERCDAVGFCFSMTVIKLLPPSSLLSTPGGNSCQATVAMECPAAKKRGTK